MTDTCTFLNDREEALVAYLYDDIDAAARTAFEAHLGSCTACRDELESLRGVRHRLATWAPPERQADVAVVNSRQSTVDRTVDRRLWTTVDSRLSTVDSRLSTVDSRLSTVDSPASPPAKASWLPDVPAWAQAVAAILILGVAAGIANLDVRYNQDGLTVRTGWSAPIESPVQSPSMGELAQGGPDPAPVSRAELVALEQRLRTEVRALQSSAHAAAATDSLPARSGVDAEQLRRVRALLDESEKRQQRELALRVGEVLRDINAQRQADLVRIDRSLGLVENNLGVEVLKQRERVNYLMRVNQRP